MVELTEGSVRDINSSKGFDNVKSQTSKSTKHGHSKTARNSIARAGTLSNTTNFPVTKWFEGPAAEQRSGELELTGCVATMSPHLKRVAAAKSKHSKIYNPEVDKIKIVQGDLFDVRDRIGLRQT